jgi:hypothetical protein
MTGRFHIHDSEAHAWRGVVLALDETPSGRAAYRVKLWHAHDPARTVCLLESFESQEVLSEWTRWALHFGLPRFVEREPGRIEGAERRIAWAEACQVPNWRRRGATIANRRPRILRRRFAPISPTNLAS